MRYLIQKLPKFKTKAQRKKKRKLTESKASGMISDSLPYIPVEFQKEVGERKIQKLTEEIIVNFSHDF